MKREIIGKSKRLLHALRMVEKVAPTNSNVLVTGESGTGKELIVRKIHERSKRADKAFVPINCGAIPKELLESELFGHEKGAFTHAIRSRAGRFELANGGTVFLDEIGELDIYLQVKLLRVLQEKEFERIGSNKTIKIDVRFIAATNKDLEEEVKKGNFREDLFYRLNVVNIYIPPLRERKEDILLLAEHFLKKFCKENNRKVLKFTNEVQDILIKYSWPGNVRELENLMERFSILCDSDVVTLDDIPPKILNCLDISTESFEQESSRDYSEKFVFPTIETLEEMGLTLKEFLEYIENILLKDALKRSGGIKNKAAKLLGIKRTTLIEKLKKKGLK